MTTQLTPEEIAAARTQVAQAKAEGRLEAEIEQLRSTLTELRSATVYLMTSSTEEQKTIARSKTRAAIDRADKVIAFFEK